MAERLCRAALDMLGVTGTALSFLTDEHHGATLCVTDEVAERLESLSLTLGEGPGLDAHRHGRPVLVPDLAGAAPDRWPAFTEQALAAGARAFFAFPIRIGAIRIGVLDLYRGAPGPLSGSRFSDAIMLADFAAQAVLAVSAQTPPGSPDLFDPAALRAEVHQATGMVAVQLGIPMDEAFVRLRAHAYLSSRLIGEVADDVIARRLRLDGSR